MRKDERNRLKIGGNRLKLLREGQRSASRKFISCESSGLSDRPATGDRTGAANYLPRFSDQIDGPHSAISGNGIHQSTSTRGAFRRDLCGPP